ncbi:hypothetical protein X798_05627 [Onchocerca flexuosa]|uniref:Uncharacterized protein n=1 Tax=Onchocerca flexuosa TaxID=387005 RepID=A0A238BPU4_9BILA|nr:hypothetical protein X798_05627 [Onchocerca flexuosa]
MLSGSGGMLNRFRVSSVSHSTDNNQKQGENESSQQRNAQLQPNVPLSVTAYSFHLSGALSVIRLMESKNIVLY